MFPARSNSYYMLVASLPALPPRLETATRLPINRQRILARMRLLEPEDRAQYDEIALFRQTIARMSNCTDEDVARQYEQMFATLTNPLLIDYVAYRRDIRIILGALRGRTRRQPPPLALNDLSRQIERAWDKPDFGLGGRHPWIVDAQDMIASGNVLGVEELMNRLSWDWLTARATEYHFSFEAVMIYTLRWNLLEAKLEWNRAEGRRRFDSLVDQALEPKHDKHAGK